jgi:hypothetical protein
MKNKMTAVEWFFNQIEQHKLTFGDVHANVLFKFRKQSKRMEKEKNIEFAKHCLNKALDTDIRTAYQDVEKYYNEIYGTTNGSRLVIRANKRICISFAI